MQRARSRSVDFDGPVLCQRKQRAGMQLAVPEQSLHVTKENDAYRDLVRRREIERRTADLRKLELFSGLQEEELRTLSDGLVYAPFAAGDAPSGIAIHPSGRFLFVANTASNDVSVYTINRVTGALTPVAGSPFPTAAAPSAIAADPHGRFIYIAAQGVISAYRIDPLTGVLTHIDDSPADMERPATDLVVDNTGTFLYAGSAGQVRGFRLEPASGQVTPLPDITG